MLCAEWRTGMEKLDETKVLKRYEDAFVRLIEIYDRKRWDEIFDAEKEFHAAWIELDQLTPKIAKLDPRYLKLISRVEARVLGEPT